MKTQESNPTKPVMSQKAALAAGVGIVGMIVPAMFAITPTETALVAGDAVQTAQNVLASGEFGSGMIALFGIVLVLDFVTSIAMWKFFRPVGRVLAGAIGASRAIYTVIFAVAIYQLTATDPNESLAAITRFNDIWRPSLLLFGTHLILVGGAVALLAFRLGYMSKWTGGIVGGLVVLGGAAHIFNNIGLLFFPGYVLSVPVTIALAAGETILGFWLLFKGRKVISAVVRKLRNKQSISS